MIHKRFNFLQQGGFPLSTDVLDFMQDAYSELCSAIVGMIGSNMVIVAGVEAGADGSFSDGWIAYHSQLLPFRASEGIYLNITRGTSNEIFEDGTVKTIRYSTSLGAVYRDTGIAISDLPRISSIKKISDEIKVLDSMGKKIINLEQFVKEYNTRDYNYITGSGWSLRYKEVGVMYEMSAVFSKSGIDIPKRMGLTGFPSTGSSHFYAVAIAEDGSGSLPCTVSFIETTNDRAMVELLAAGADPNKLYHIQISGNVPKKIIIA